MSQNPNKLLTISEAAAIKGVSRPAIYAAMRTGKLSYTEIQVTESQRRMTQAALDSWHPNTSKQRCGRRKVAGK